MKGKRRRYNTAVVLAREQVLEGAGKLSTDLTICEAMKYMEELDVILDKLFQEGIKEGKKIAQKPCDN